MDIGDIGRRQQNKLKTTPHTEQEPETLNLPGRQRAVETQAQGFAEEKTDMRQLFTGLGKPAIMSIKHLTTFLNCVFDILFVLVLVFYFQMIGLKIFK